MKPGSNYKVAAYLKNKVAPCLIWLADPDPAKTQK